MKISKLHSHFKNFSTLFDLTGKENLRFKILRNLKNLRNKNNKYKAKGIRNQKIDELEMLQENLKFGKLKSKFWGTSHIIKDQTELRKQTRKKIGNIERLKTEIEEAKEWEFKSVKLLEDLNFGKHDEIAEIEEIEIRLGALGISKTTINAFKKLIISNEYLYLLL